jgi:hypothetical protein
MPAKWWCTVHCRAAGGDTTSMRAQFTQVQQQPEPAQPHNCSRMADSSTAWCTAHMHSPHAQPGPTTAPDTHLHEYVDLAVLVLHPALDLIGARLTQQALQLRQLLLAHLKGRGVGGVTPGAVRRVCKGCCCSAVTGTGHKHQVPLPLPS